MLQKVKDFFNTISGTVIAVLTLIIGILIYFLSARKKEVNSLKAQIALVETQKQADLLETEIKQRMHSKECLAEEVKQLEIGLQMLEEKRKQLANASTNKDPIDVEEFWRKN